jgi:hypothetical protein
MSGLLWSATSTSTSISRSLPTPRFHPLGIVIGPLVGLKSWWFRGGEPSDRLEGIGVVDSWEVNKSVRVLLGSTVSFLLRRLLWWKWILLRIRSALKRRVMKGLLSAWLRPGSCNQSLSPCDTSTGSIISRRGTNGCIVTATLARSVVIILGVDPGWLLLLVVVKEWKLHETSTVRTTVHGSNTVQVYVQSLS